MIPRRLVVAVGSVALMGSLFMAPSFAATGTTTTPKPHHTRLTCDPVAKNKTTSPAIGAQATFQAGGAGSVVVKRNDATTLAVVSTAPASGWTAQVTVASGRHLKVQFANATSLEAQHFGIALSSRGTFVMVTTSHCHH
jgi:hypothetical protein